MAVEFTREEFALHTQTFEDIDRNKDGVIDLIEFQACMEAVARRAGKRSSFEKVRRMFDDADRNKDGLLQYDEWMAAQLKIKRERLRTAMRRGGRVDSSGALQAPRGTRPREAGAGADLDENSAGLDDESMMGRASQVAAELSAMAKDPGVGQSKVQRSVTVAAQGGRLSAREAGDGEPAAAGPPVRPAQLSAAPRVPARSGGLLFKLSSESPKEVVVPADARAPASAHFHSTADGVSSVDALHRLLGALAAEGDGRVAREAARLLAATRREASGDARFDIESEEEADAEVRPLVRVSRRHAAGASASAAGSEDEDEDETDSASVVGMADVSPEIATDSDEEAQGDRRHRRNLDNATNTGRSMAVASSGAASAFSSISAALAALAAPLEIFLSQLQFTGLTSAIFYRMLDMPGVSIPKDVSNAWSAVLGWTDFLNFDSLGVAAMLKALPSTQLLDSFRLQLAAFIEAMPWSWVYVSLTCLTPLGIAFVVLLIYKSTARVLWLFGIAAGIATLLTGLLLRFLVPIERLVLLNPNITPDIFTWLTIAGLGMVAVCLLIQAMAGWFSLRIALIKAKFKLRLTAERYKRKDSSALERSLAADAARTRYGAPKSPIIVLRSALLALLLLSLAVAPFLAAYGKSESEIAALQSNPLFHPVLQILFFVLFAIFATHFALLTCEWGRKRIADVGAIINAVFIDILLLVLSLLFTPIARFLLAVFVPLNLRCGSGEWFPVFSYALETAILGAASPQAALSAASGKGRDEVCESCDFFDFGANAHSSASGTSNISLSGVTPVLSTACAAYPRACEGQDIIVLDADRSLDFNSQVQPFYYPASLLMLIGFTGMLIYLYYAIVRAHVRALDTVPIDSDALADVAERAASQRWRLCSLLMCSNPKAQPSPVALSCIAIGGAAHSLSSIPITPRGLTRSPRGENSSPVTVDGEDVDQHTRENQLHAERAQAASASLAWEYRVLRSRNRARTVYIHFSYRWRYFRMIHVVQKLVLVLIVTFAANRVPVANICLLTIYALWFLVALLQRPYFDGASNALNVAASMACTVNAILLLLAYHGVLASVSELGMVILLITFNLVLPIVCLGAGLFFACRQRRKLAAIADELEGALTPTQLVELMTKRKRVDSELNKTTLKLFASAFMTSAFCAVLAVFTIVLGQVYASAQGAVVQATPTSLGKLLRDVQGYPQCEVESRMAVVEFLYVEDASWPAFASQCCCRDRYPGVPALANRTELWTCEDKEASSDSSRAIHKQRNRVVTNDDGTERSGLAMRAFCAPAFEPGVRAPAWDEEMLAYVPRLEASDELPDNWELW